MGKKKDAERKRKVKSRCCEKPPHKRCKRCPLR